MAAASPGVLVIAPFIRPRLSAPGRSNSLETAIVVNPPDMTIRTPITPYCNPLVRIMLKNLGPA